MIPKQRFRNALRNHGHRAAISVHRGLWGPAPENSLSAILDGTKLGIVEFDIQLAADGRPVVIHDETLGRVCGLPMLVSGTPSQVLAMQRLREGAGGGSAGTSPETIPLLDEILSAAPKGTFFDFDAKNPDEVERIASYISGAGAAGLGSVKIDTRDDSDIDRLAAMEREFGLMVMAKVILPEAGIDHIAALRRAGVAAAEVWFESVDELSEACRVAGEDMAISTYTLDPVHCCGLSDSKALNDPGGVWGRLIDAGVSIIMTDRPRELARYLDSL